MLGLNIGLGQLCNRVGIIAALYVRTARRLIITLTFLAPHYHKIVMRDVFASL